MAARAEVAEVAEVVVEMVKVVEVAKVRDVARGVRCCDGKIGRPPPTTYHLLLATCTTCHLPLATCHLPLATCHLPLVTCCLLLATYSRARSLTQGSSNRSRDASARPLRRSTPRPLLCASPTPNGAHCTSASARMTCRPAATRRARDPICFEQAGGRTAGGASSPVCDV